MSDLETPAVPAGDDVLPETEVAAVETVDEPEGEQTEEQKAEVSRSKQRREQRAREMERLRQSEAQAREREAQLAAELDRIKRAQQDIPAPRQADYQDPAAYQAALTAYMATKMLDQRQERTLQQEAQEVSAQVQQARTLQQQADDAAFAALEAEARTRLPDYEAVTRAPDLPITPQMAAVIKASDHAPDIAYYLGKNRQDAERIARMPPVQMALALGRIEAAVSSPRTAPPVSNAPAPITPVKAKATASVDPLKMSPREYAEWRAKGGTFTL